LEKIEQLEQLRALEYNIPIRIVDVDYKGRTHGSINSPYDIKVIEKILNKEGEFIS
jgi:3-deoxy-manno-octulosonate cytidylyltransferase (CMP-KDO synthetase)